MGGWISCPPRSNADRLITLLFHSGGTITTDTFSWYFVRPQRQQRREWGRYKLIVWQRNQSQSSSADGLMALMAVAGWRQERLVWTQGSWMYVSCMEGCMILFRGRGQWKMLDFGGSMWCTFVLLLSRVIGSHAHDAPVGFYNMINLLLQCCDTRFNAQSKFTLTPPSETYCRLPCWYCAFEGSISHKKWVHASERVEQICAKEQNNWIGRLKNTLS